MRNLDLTGLLDSINKAVTNTDFGRKGFAITDKERQGRISYEDGIAEAMTAFQEARTTSAPQIIILAEYTFLAQEDVDIVDFDNNVDFYSLLNRQGELVEIG